MFYPSAVYCAGSSPRSETSRTRYAPATEQINDRPWAEQGVRTAVTTVAIHGFTTVRQQLQCLDSQRECTSGSSWGNMEMSRLPPLFVQGLIR